MTKAELIKAMEDYPDDAPVDIYIVYRNEAADVVEVKPFEPEFGYITLVAR